MEFSRGFVGEKVVEGIEMERRRVVVYELELGWWILVVSFLLFFFVEYGEVKCVIDKMSGIVD